MVRVEVFVEKPQRPDHVAPDISEQRIGDAVARAEVAERLHRVVADREERDVMRLERPENLLQLDQLHFAERSPLRTAVEHDDGAPAAPNLMKVDGWPV